MVVTAHDTKAPGFSVHAPTGGVVAFRDGIERGEDDRSDFKCHGLRVVQPPLRGISPPSTLTSRCGNGISTPISLSAIQIIR